MSNLEAVQLVDGSTIMVEPKKAVAMRARIQQKLAWKKQVSREVSKPYYGGRNLRQVTGSNHAVANKEPEHTRITTPTQWCLYKEAERKKLINARWGKVASL